MECQAKQMSFTLSMLLSFHPLKTGDCCDINIHTSIVHDQLNRTKYQEKHVFIFQIILNFFLQNYYSILKCCVLITYRSE